MPCSGDGFDARIICSPRLGWAPVRGNAAGYFSTSEAAHFVIVLGQLFHIGDEFLLALDGAVEGRKIFPNAIFWIFRRPEREDGEGRIPAVQHGECHMPDFYRWMPVFGAANCKCHFERSEEHTSELQYLMRISYAVLCLKKKTAR